MRFEPAGITDDPDLRLANSLIDYLFRRLALDYLSYPERLNLGVLGTDERLQQTLPGVEEHAVGSSQGLDLAKPGAEVEGGYITGDLIEVAAAEPAIAEPPMGIAMDAPLCMQCGIQMTRAGSCYVCSACGSTSGCS
jgi:ribonucleoside-diphosphate reductase alpha chain